MNKIIKNTGALYFKSILSVGISLASTRYALQFLGEDSYGTFIVLAGVISSLSFLNGAMSVGIQRYMSFYQSSEDDNIQKRIFSNGLVIQLILALTIVIVLISIENYLFNNVLKIGDTEMGKLVYNIMLISVFISITSVPFTSLINAHEEMQYIAIIGFLQVILVFVLSFSLKFFFANKLLIYATGMAIIQFIIGTAYAIICIRRYSEITFRIKLYFHKGLIKELLSFCGWNTIGAITGTLKNQGIAILLNTQLGTTINAAYGVASKLSDQLSFFSVTIQNVVNPQIMKHEGAGNRSNMIKLSLISSRASFFLFAIFAFPLIFEVQAVLNLWLKDVPDYTTSIMQLLLVAVLFNQTSIGCISGIQAIGNIKNYYLVVGGSKILMLPISLVILILGLDVFWVFVNYAFFELFASIFRVFMFVRITKMKISVFITEVLQKEMIPSIITILISVLMINLIPNENRFFISIPVIASVFIVTTYLWGINSEERSLLKQQLVQLYEDTSRRYKHR